MLYVPFVVGVLVAGRVSWHVLLLGLAITLVFIARESLLAWWRARQRGREAGEAGKWLVVYLGLAAASGAPLILWSHFYWLIPLGLLVAALLAVNTLQAGQREDRTVLGESLAILGLTLTAPSAHYVAVGALSPVALWLWALSALYFTSSIFYVKLRVLQLNPRKAQARQRAWWLCALYHLFLSVSLLALALTGGLHLFAVVAFAPVLVSRFLALSQPAGQLSLRRVGVQEICYSLFFLVFITLTFRS